MVVPVPPPNSGKRRRSAVIEASPCRNQALEDLVANCPSRMTGTGSGMFRPTRDDTRRCSTELAVRLQKPVMRSPPQATQVRAPAPGLVQPHLAPEPGVRGRNAGGELQEVVAGRERAGGPGSPTGAGARTAPSRRRRSRPVRRAWRRNHCQASSSRVMTGHSLRISIAVPRLSEARTRSG